MLGIVLVLAACGSGEEAGSPGQESPSNNQGAENGNESAVDENYYEGKTIELVVGYNPGGGVDLAGRVVANHLGKHIPGNPDIMVVNLAGGAGITSANVLYNETEPDGLTIGTPSRGNWLSSAIMGDPAVNYKLEDYGWIGSVGEPPIVMVVADDSGIKSFDDLMAAPKESVIFGSFRKNDQVYVVPYLLSKYAPAIKPVTGYDGSGETLLALERGEIQGAFLPYDAIMARLGSQIEEGKYHLIAIRGEYEEFTDSGMTNIYDVLSEEDAQLVDFIAAPVGIPMVTPPGTDPQIVNILREAYAKLADDEEFLAEAAKQNVYINIIEGEELEQIVNTLINTPGEIIEQARQFNE
jgi:tripartite-type tricarboxylate transporter receptor subunit TctC